VRPNSNWFWGPAHPEYFIGFILSFLFFGSLSGWFFGKNKKLKTWLWHVLPFLFFLLFLGAYEELIIGSGVVAIGWFFALVAAGLKNKFKQ